ncbi:MAG: J domain-containing protein [Polyangiaceae bacterium]
MATMTFAEAVACLGLEEPFSQADARRAYLRLLKRHKPESDPQGFMRVREAYDIVNDVARDEARDEAPDEGFAQPAPEPPAPAPEAPATEPQPPAPEPTAPEPAAPESPAAEPPRAGKPLTPKQAAKVLRKMLDQARLDATAPTPPVDAAVITLLALLQKPEHERQASRLYEAIRQYAEHAHVGRVLSPPGLIAWGLTQSLWENRSAIPANLRPPLARAIRAGRPDLAANWLIDFATNEPLRARQLHEELTREAPQLAQLFGQWLLPPRANPPTKPRGTPVRYWPLYLVFIGLSRVLASAGNCSSPSYRPTPQFSADQRPRPSPTPLRWPSVPPETPKTPIQELAQTTENMHLPELSGAISALDAALARNDCSAATEHARRIASLANGLTEQQAKSIENELDYLRVLVIQSCPPVSP